VYAVLEARKKVRLARAFMKWRYTAAALAATQRIDRERLQAAVTSDQARAERGVYERARMQLSRERKAVLLHAAIKRWRDAAVVQRLAEERNVAVGVATQMAEQLRDARAAVEAALAREHAARAAALQDGAEMMRELHAALAGRPRPQAPVAGETLSSV
jgi:hypothetical protein